MQPDSQRPDTPDDAAGAAQARAHDARERAVVARRAAELATTEYARRAHNRSAELHDELALSHEDSARRLRSDGGRAAITGSG
jgi:hypothetical protein